MISLEKWIKLLYSKIFKNSEVHAKVLEERMKWATDDAIW